MNLLIPPPNEILAVFNSCVPRSLFR